MKVTAITRTLLSKIRSEENLHSLFLNIVIPTINSIDTDDYCCIIDVLAQKDKTIIKIHDGGVEYDQVKEETVYRYYALLESLITVEEDMKLYYDFDNGILCYLDER